MRQLWMLIFVASLCDWVSGQARYTYYLERRPAGRPGNQRRPPEQSDQRPPDRDPDPTRWRSGNIEYVEKCTNGYMLDAFVANYHPTSPVFCADCVREDGTIKRRSCLDLNYCIGFHTRTETLIRQWNGGAFRTGDCYSVTLLPEPLNTEKKEYRIQCVCRTRAANPVTGARAAQKTFPLGVLVNDDGFITCFSPPPNG